MPVHPHQLHRMGKSGYLVPHRCRRPGSSDRATSRRNRTLGRVLLSPPTGPSGMPLNTRRGNHDRHLCKSCDLVYKHCTEICSLHQLRNPPLRHQAWLEFIALRKTQRRPKRNCGERLCRLSASPQKIKRMRDGLLNSLSSVFYPRRAAAVKHLVVKPNTAPQSRGSQSPEQRPGCNSSTPAKLTTRASARPDQETAGVASLFLTGTTGTANKSSCDSGVSSSMSAIARLSSTSGKIRAVFDCLTEW